jgi:mRNA interferase RelE/StbE
MSTFIVELNNDAQSDLQEIKDTRTRRAITSGLLRLETEPAKRGKTLGDDLQGYHSIRVAGQRYRAVYSISVSRGVVTVVVIAIRKEGDKRDAYRVASKRLGRK